jgi:hypothetical protein
MFFLLIPSLLCIHAALLTGHVHLYAHVVLIIVILVFSIVLTVRTFTTNSTPAIRALASSPPCAAHDTRCISIALLLALLPPCAIND